MGVVQSCMLPSEEAPGNVVLFGDYRLLVRQRQLLRADVAVEIGDRAFDVLVALVESAGKTISKNELILEAWSGTVVGENALQAQITALRRAFGADRRLIVTVSGRGYQFAGELRSSPPAREPHPYPTSLPERTLALVGREHEIDRLAGLVRTQRLVTIVGFGGVGKSVLGRELARLLIPEFAGGVAWIDLAASRSLHAARETILEVLGDTGAADVLAAATIPSMIDAPSRLLVLDGCERWIDLAAELTDATLRLDIATRVLTTSREALHVEGESTYRLGPLTLPDNESRDGDAVSKTPAVRLFLTRLAAAGGSEPSTEVGLNAASAICLALDGIPLAIEMAASRAAGVGVEWVVAHLDQRMGWLTNGSRTTPDRQRSMQASFDWSFESLLAPDRWALKQLSELNDTFTLEDACSLLQRDGIEVADALDRLGTLVGKSLVERLESGGKVSYRLFHMTRGCAQAMPWSRA